MNLMTFLVPWMKNEIGRENVETVKENAEDWINNVGICDNDGVWIEEFIGCQQLSFISLENPKVLAFSQCFLQMKFSTIF